MKKILLTGIAGFIGSFVAKALFERGYEVIGVDNFNKYYTTRLKRDRVKDVVPASIKIHEFDILNKLELHKLAYESDFDAIVHLAAQPGVRYSLKNPELYIQSNVQGTNNIFELARQHHIPKVVFASSSSIYGSNSNVPFSESDMVDNPSSLYAATKKANELQASVYNKIYGIELIGLRFFTVYGPWTRPDMALYKFAKAMVKGDAIDVYNNGNLERDFTFISDIVEGVISSLETNFNKGFEIINLGNSDPVPLMTFISLIEKELGVEAKKNMLPMQEGDVLTTYADIEKAKRLLDYSPVVSVDKGIHEFIKWFKSYSHSSE